MMIDTFLHGLNQRGLWLDVSTPLKGMVKLVLSGEQSQVTEHIRSYIHANREPLIKHLQETVSNRLITDVDTNELRSVPCYLSEYGLCSNQIIEQDETTWRMSPEGLAFCLECWQSRNIEQAERAIPYLADHDQLTDLGTRIERIMKSPGYGCCGGHDWRVDYDGVLVCHHVIESRERIEQDRAEIKPLPARTKTKTSAA